MGRLLCVAMVLLWGCDRGANYITIIPDEGPPVDVVADTGTDIVQGDISDSFDSTDSTSEPDVPDTGVEVTDTNVEDVPVDIAVDTGPVSCDPPLSIEPKDSYRLALQQQQFSATGGTGAYRFALEDNVSGALLEPLLGSYLTGSVFGVTDRVRVIDLGCVGEDETSVHVVSEMRVLPQTVSLASAMSFQMDVNDGSGSFAYALASNGSGGTLSPTGFYEAGAGTGTDVIEVLDMETEQVEIVEVLVAEEAHLAAGPSSLIVPLHQPIRPKINGGSGVFRYESDGDLLDHGDGRIEAVTVGTTVVTVDDVYTGQTTTLSIEAVASNQFPPVHIGMRGDITTGLQAGEVVVAGDLNGDGFEDVVLAVYEASIDEAYEGAVFVYKGGAGGMDPTPAQVLRGGIRERYFGWSVDVADFNSDGLEDVAVGIMSDLGDGNYAGAVEIFHGIEGGFFATSPGQRLEATSAWDYYAHSLTSCDFNHDGYMDLAVGAPWEDNLGVAGSATNNGGVFIHLGGEDKLSPTPTQMLQGRSPTGGGVWAPLSAAYLGMDMASGDVNGDGICDLLVSGRNGTSGAVFLHLGMIDSAEAQGGVTPEPYLAWNGKHASFNDGYFGWSVAVGDVSDDGYADIIIGARYDEYTTGLSCSVNADCDPADNTIRCNTHKVDGVNVKECSRINGGAVYVKMGSELPLSSLEDWSSFDSFERIYWGGASWDGLGGFVHTADANGDGIEDVLIASDTGGTVGTARPGTLDVYLGVAGGPPEEIAFRELRSIYPEDYVSDRDWLGHGVGVLSDVDGDQVDDYFVYMARDDHYGHDVGRPYVVSGAVGENEEDLDVWYPLDLPIIATGHEFGRSVGILPDLNGDGNPELAVGAPHDSHVNAARDGSVYIYAGNASGFDTAAPIQALRSPQIKDASYQYDVSSFGRGVSRGGDFDDDGNPDLVVLAQRESRPGNLWADYQVGPGGVTTCGGGLGAAGAVYIYSSTAEGLLSEFPTFTYYGTQKWQSMHGLLGDLDINGDGKSDVMASSLNWDFMGRNNVGGVAILFGRAAWDAEKINVICNEDVMLHGAIAGDKMQSMASLGDLNNDGCDDFAVGAPYDDQAANDAGSVHVVFGWGPTCMYQTIHRVSLGVASGGAWMGISLAGGHDADGDGVNDLLVGGTGYRVDNLNHGAVYFVSGSRILEYSPEAWTVGSRPTILYPLFNASLSNSVVGDMVNGDFGAQVGFLPGKGTDGNAAVVVTQPRGTFGGPAGTGGAYVYAVESDGTLGSNPILVMHGESSRAVTQIGTSMDTGVDSQGGAVWAVGSHRASGAGIARGAVYGVRIPAP